MHKITIVGGGTAGWLTALYLNKICFDSEVTLIESESIGILGAGEGSTVLLSSFLWELQIDETEFIKNTNATFKLGINFSNWRADGKSYFHPFKSFGHLDPNPANVVGSTIRDLQIVSNGTEYGYLNLKANSNGEPVVLVADKLALNNKGPFSSVNGMMGGLTKYSYHFDAVLVAKYLRKIAEERGVKRIEGQVEEIYGSPINKITVSGQTVDCDFVFDCSGFHKKIIKTLDSQWLSYKHMLKVDTALPFFLEKEEEFTRSYTDSIAMKYGWMWKIPLQHRYGCGYVFDSSYTSVEEAKKEVEETIGKELQFNKVIEFEAGRYKDVFIDNCIAVGLSASFLEPLEATAINTIIEQLLRLNKSMIEYPTKQTRHEYNTSIGEMVDEIADIIYLHYLTDKQDTDFWKDYSSTTTISKSLQSKLNSWKERTPNRFDAKTDSLTFPLLSQFIIASNVHPDIISMDVIRKENDIYNLDEKLSFWRTTYEHQLTNIMDVAVDHKEYLDKLCKE